MIDGYLDGSMLASARQKAEAEITRSLARLRPEEAAVLALLEQRLAREASQMDLRNSLAGSLKMAKRSSKGNRRVRLNGEGSKKFCSS